MGKSAVIICKGQFPKKEYPLYVLGEADYILCCDGALKTYLRHAEKMALKRPSDGQTVRIPDVVIGDMDSLSPRFKKDYPGVMVHESEQDDNDQTKAVRYAIGHFKDISNIHILGATGMREDHTVGNMSLLMEYTRMFDLKGLGIDMISDYGTTFAVTDTVTLEVGTGRAISIFSPDNSLRISSKGLTWPTDGVVFDNWWKATLNRACEDSVTLTFSHPSIALVFLD
jgi:thiamine pyrophosphokinase